MHEIKGTGWEELYLGGSLEAEKKLLAEVIPRVMQIQKVVAEKQGKEIRRGFHNKGVPVKMNFQVEESLPECLQNDFLKPGKKYDGIGRFSRSRSKFGKDKELDQRGFAFRANAEEGAQDFLFSNTPVSFAEDPITFLEGGLIIASHSRPVVALKLILKYGPKKGLRIISDILGSPDRDLSFTCQRYWTRTPFQVNDSAVSFTIIPENEIEVRVDNTHDDGLSNQLRSDLLDAPKIFKLVAQFFISEKKTPIENANTEWKEEDSPLIPVGTITILKQDIQEVGNKEAIKAIELEAAFNPWTTTCIHPLGAMNRSRKEAYKQSALNRGGKPENV